MNDRTEANGTPTLTDRVKELRLAGKMDGQSPRGAGGTAWLPWLLCFFLAVGWSAYGIKAYKSTPKPTDGGLATDPNAPVGPAASTSAESAADAIDLVVKGYLIPTQQISISPIDVAGRVTALHIEEGKPFKKGDVLAEIDPTPYKAMQAEFIAQKAAALARYMELQAGSRPEEVAQAQAELEDAKATFEQFRREWERFKAQSTAAITTREYEQAEAGYLSALRRVEARQKAFDLVKAGPRRERVDAARAEHDAAKARLEQTEWKLRNCTIISPVTGVILTKKAEIGSLLNPVVGGVSTNLCDIADLRKLEVDLEVQERDISRVEINQACRVVSDAFPKRVYEGYVERVMPIANRAKSVVPVRIKVVPRKDEVQGQYLKPEMGVTVTFLKKTVDAAYKAEVQKLLDDDSAASIAPKK
jgi:HlyD family secretion protein